MNNATEQAPKLSPAFIMGRTASAKWETPACPYDIKSKDAGEWSDGLLAGRQAFSWNARNLVGIGATCRYLSEAVSRDLAVSIGKSIFHIGAEAPVLFRVGFIINGHDCQTPILDVQGWRDVSMVCNRALQGRPLEECGLTREPTWLERLTFICGRSFMLDIIGEPLPAAMEEGKHMFEVELARVLPWMGGNDDHADLIPKPPGA